MVHSLETISVKEDIGTGNTEGLCGKQAEEELGWEGEKLVFISPGDVGRT